MIFYWLKLKQTLFILFLFFLVSCKRDRLNVDVSKVEIQFEIQRFETDLFDETYPENSEKAAQLRNKYSNFYPIFTQNIISIGNADNPATSIYLNDFITDKDIVNLHQDVIQNFPDPLPFSAELENAWKHYRYHFPSEPLPKIVTFISGLNYSIISTDSVAGIGLDMYLGEDYPVYASMGLPQYKRAKMKPGFIVTDCMRGWFQSEYEFIDPDATFLDEMIYMGKILYLTQATTPKAPQHLKFNYTTEQFDWCRNNEANIWNHFLQRNILYSKQQSEYAKFLVEGPTTSGFPPHAPSQLGNFIGHRIITQFMNNNRNITLQQLIAETNAQKILQQSKYKPN